MCRQRSRLAEEVCISSWLFVAANPAQFFPLFRSTWIGKDSRWHGIEERRMCASCFSRLLPLLVFAYLWVLFIYCTYYSYARTAIRMPGSINQVEKRLMRVSWIWWHQQQFVVERGTFLIYIHIDNAAMYVFVCQKEASYVVGIRCYDKRYSPKNLFILFKKKNNPKTYYTAFFGFAEKKAFIEIKINKHHKDVFIQSIHQIHVCILKVTRSNVPIHYAVSSSDGAALFTKFMNIRAAY